MSINFADTERRLPYEITTATKCRIGVFGPCVWGPIVWGVDS